ncbi:MAG: Rrf2 family transcriptional regulator [Candidatus Binataceae bacterium]|nr:Rrf2 family transcriptional regulator [Candidatus Binataceae bacterium]
MLTHKSKYALKALIVLAREFGHGPVLISNIAEREGIPRKFLELILLELKNHGILLSKKGKGGGYALGRAPAAIHVSDVLRVLDGPLAPTPCVSRTAYMRCAECLDERTCGVRLVMKQVRDATAAILDATSLADIVVRIDQAARGKPALTYSI